MKNLFSFIRGFLLMVMFCTGVEAQNPGESVRLSKAIVGILESSSRNFSDLRGEKYDDYHWKTKLNLTGATESYIDSSGSHFLLRTVFGSHSTREDAKSTIQKLIRDFEKDSVPLQFRQRNENSYYVAFQHYPDQELYYRMKFNIYNSIDGFFKVEFDVESPIQGEPLYVEYNQVKVDTIQNAFSLSLNNLLEKAASGFEPFKGDMIEERYTKKYSTSLALEGAYKNYIETSYFGGNYFIGVMGSIAKQEDVGKALEIVGGQVASALGKDYYWCYYPNRATISFVHKSNLSIVDASSVRVECMTESNEILLFIEVPEPITLFY